MILSLLPHQAAEVFDDSHSTVISIGGLGSGKTLCAGLWILDRAEWDGSQLHGLFGNTVVQLENGILPEVFKLLEAADVEFEYNHMPPAAWRKEWRERGVPLAPQPANFRRILTLRSGLTVLCGTLFNRSFMQYRSLQFGSAKIDEFTNGPSLKAVQFIAERVRCGARADCASRHRHTVYLSGNPPDDAGHWIFSYLDAAERAAERHFVGELPPREPGTYPLLTRGIGGAILISSRTWDNDNLGDGYADALAEQYDEETARRRLGGELVRATSGRAAESFHVRNVHTVNYDPRKTVYACFDFDLEPAVCCFAHPLTRGEYPDEWHRPGVEFVGVFGEYVNTRGISVRRLAEEVVKGDRGEGLDYRDPGLRGLPRNWEGLRGQQERFIAYGDSTGNMRSKNADNTESSWQITGEILRQVGTHVDGGFRQLYSRDVADFNPSPRARLHALNAKLENSTKKVSLIIDPRCEQLIADMEQCIWDTDQNETRLKKWGKRAGGILYCRGHLLDALSYMIHQRFPLGHEVSTRNPIDLIPKWPSPTLKAPAMR